MKNPRRTLALVPLLAATTLTLGPGPADQKTTPTLVHQTNFEGQRVEPSRGSDDKLVGRDTTLPNSDPAEELKSRWGVGELQIQYTGGDASLRTGRLVPDPVNPANQVLHFQIKEGWVADGNQKKARVQANLYAFKTGFKEFYQSVRVFIPEHMNELRKFPKAIPWLTISEFWNNAWWGVHTYGFRVTLGIGKPAGEHDLVFILDAQDPGMKEVWEVHNKDVKVPIGKWFTMDYYYKEGNDKTGRFYIAITPDGGEKKVVYDVRNFTHNTKDPAPDGITSYNPMKLYTSAELAAFMKSKGASLDIYWDDFRLWTDKQP